MPYLTDASEIRVLLERDRNWSAYALGDLEPGFARHTAWVGSSDQGALAMLYRGFDLPVLFTQGCGEALDAVLSEILSPPLPAFYLHVNPPALSWLRGTHRIEPEKPMRRMILEPARLKEPDAAVFRLGSGDLGAIQRLYADGQCGPDRPEESPDFFFPFMLDQGVFYGLREGDDLVAAAGTHLVAPGESVAAIGNVYTRRDRRGRGYGRQVTAAVAVELRRRGIRTIALNVAPANTSAIRVYEALGFTHYCDYYEGMAHRVW